MKDVIMEIISLPETLKPIVETIELERHCDSLPGSREYAEAIQGWYDEVMGAKYWLGISKLSPTEAAMLLCQYNPLDTLGPETHTNEEIKNDEYVRMKRAFEDKEQPKDLRAWLDVAKSKGLKYHSWIDKYLGSVAATTKPAKPQGEPVQGESRKDKAHAIADEIALKRYKDGWREITQRNICGAVAEEMEKDTANNGTRGPLSDGTVRTALKGWKFSPPTGTNGTNGTEK